MSPKFTYHTSLCRLPLPPPFFYPVSISPSLNLPPPPTSPPSHAFRRISLFTAFARIIPINAYNHNLLPHRSPLDGIFLERCQRFVNVWSKVPVQNVSSSFPPDPTNLQSVLSSYLGSFAYFQCLFSVQMKAPISHIPRLCVFILSDGRTEAPTDRRSTVFFLLLSLLLPRLPISVGRSVAALLNRLRP